MDSYQPAREGGSYEIPPLTNQPPQVFGPHAPTSPTNGLYSADYFGDEQNGGTVEESNEAKRRRIAKACDMCRKKKIKCDGKMPSCSHCINYKTECVFTQVEKKRNPPKGAKYIEGLENRLGRMESLLKLSGLLNEDDGDRTDLGTLERRLADKTRHMSNGDRSSKSPSGSDRFSQPQESIESPYLASPENDREQRQNRRHSRQSRQSPRPTPRSPEAAKEKEGEVEALSDMMCSLVTNNCGETRYIGSSSGFSIFSPKGIQWVNEKTGDNSFQDMIVSAGNDEKQLMHWKPEVFGDIFTRKVYMALPSRHEALSLLKDYFENFNCIFPLFHEPTFMHLVNRHYSRDPYNGSGWWASLNVALAIAHRLRVVSNLVSVEEDNKAWGFMKNSLAVFAELTMRNTDLLSVQALLGMALFLQGTPNPQPSFVLVAAAIRLAHSIGLHKRGSGFNLNPVEVEQRKRVFWIAYLLDKDICLRSGRPPAQDDDDMNVDLPSQDPGDNVGNIPLTDGKGKLNLFRLMCTFSVIQSKVYKQLYSTKASKQSDGALLNTIGELDHELEEWKDAIPIDFRPEHEIKATHTPLILHVVVLHFAYYNCLTTIHRMSVHHGYWTSRLSNYAIQGLNARPLNPRVFSSAAVCVQAARASIHLLKYIPQGDYACVWMIIYYPVSALVTLFANVLQNPQDARARSDIRLMDQVVHFLSLLTHGEEQAGVRRMHATCEEFERIARTVLERAEKESHSRRKRKNNGASKDDKDENKEAKTVKEESTDKSEATSPNLTANKEANGSYLPNSPDTAPGLTPDSGLMPPAFAGDNSTPRSNFAMLSGASPNSPATSINSNPNNVNSLAIQMPDYMPAPGDFPNMMTPLNGYPSFPTTQAEFEQQYGNGQGMPNLEDGYSQQFIPQDVWQLPMTLDWDWTDMAGGGAGPTMFEAGMNSLNGMNMEAQRQG